MTNQKPLVDEILEEDEGLTQAQIEAIERKKKREIEKEMARKSKELFETENISMKAAEAMRKATSIGKRTIKELNKIEPKYIGSATRIIMTLLLENLRMLGIHDGGEK